MITREKLEYVGNVKMCIEWNPVFKDENGKHYVHNGASNYMEINPSSYNIFRV